VANADGIISRKRKTRCASESDAVIDHIAKPSPQPIAAFIGQFATQRISEHPSIWKGEIHEQIDVAERVSLVVAEVDEKIEAI